MNKEAFDMIQDFFKIEFEIYTKLVERGIPEDEVEEIIDSSWDYRERTLRIGKYLVEEDYVNKHTYITEKYENVAKYLKLEIIYEYENKMALCVSTAEYYYLVPMNLLECYANSSN